LGLYRRECLDYLRLYLQLRTGLGLIGIVIDHVSTLIYSKKNKNVQVQ
jgi:hypothetical protein